MENVIQSACEKKIIFTFRMEIRKNRDWFCAENVQRDVTYQFGVHLKPLVTSKGS